MLLAPGRKKAILPETTLDLIHEKNAFDIELYACGQRDI